MSDVIEHLRARGDLVVAMKADIEARLKVVGEQERACMSERWELQSALKAIEELSRRKP